MVINVRVTVVIVGEARGVVDFIMLTLALTKVLGKYAFPINFSLKAAPLNDIGLFLGFYFAFHTPRKSSRFVVKEQFTF